MAPLDLASGAAAARDVLLVALLVAASWTDTRTARIRNVHTAPAMLAGIALSAVAGGLAGAWDALLGIAVAFGVMFPLYAMGVLKAGDAKLLMGVGALAGAGVAVRGLLLSCFVFIPVAVVVLILRRRHHGIWTAVKGLWRFAYTSLHPLLKAEPLPAGEAVMMPFGLVLSLGVLLAWRTDLLRIPLLEG